MGNLVGQRFQIESYTVSANVRRQTFADSEWYGGGSEKETEMPSRDCINNSCQGVSNLPYGLFIIFVSCVLESRHVVWRNQSMIRGNAMWFQ